MIDIKKKVVGHMNVMQSEKDDTLTFHGISVTDEFTEGYIPLAYTAVGIPNHWMHMQSGQNTFSENRLVKFSADEKAETYEYARDSHGFSAKINLELMKEGCVVQENHLKCHNASSVVTGLNSGVFETFPFKRYETDRFEISYFRQSWQAEGQLKTVSFEDAAVITSSDHPSCSTFRIGSIGTFTTAEYYPLVFVYDKKRDETAFYQLFPLTEWFIEIGIVASWTSDTCSVFIGGGCFDERYSSYNKNMRCGDEITARKCLYGVVKGGSEEAVKCLYKARRKLYAASIQTKAVAYYNDYLNCCWSNPIDEVTFPLAKKAKELGFDCFIMDAGWFSNRGDAWDKALGDWSFSSNRFSTGKLSDFVKKLKCIGIRVGVWTECEVCGENSELFNKPMEWFLCEEGVRIGGGNRVFLDFTNPDVRSYIETLYRKLKSIGVDCIKNDYNDSVFRAQKGADRNHLNASVAEYYLLMKKIREEVGLTIESCSSGAMRADPTIIGCFDYQSISDQEDYLRYPSIIKGSLYCTLPEKTGVWGVHNPLLFKQFLKGNGFRTSDEFYAQCNDVQRLLFNLVSAMTGIMYFSGWITESNSECDELIKKALSVYKSIYPFILQAYPVCEKSDGRLLLNGYDFLRYENEDKTEALLYVWKNGGERFVSILTDYTKVEIVLSCNQSFIAETKNGKLTIGSEHNVSAAIFRLKK